MYFHVYYSQVGFPKWRYPELDALKEHPFILNGFYSGFPPFISFCKLEPVAIAKTFPQQYPPIGRVVINRVQWTNSQAAW